MRAPHRKIAAAAIATLLTAGTWTSAAEPAHADEAPVFDKTLVISDTAFYDGDALTEDQIRIFIQSRGSTCAPTSGSDPRTCLKDIVFPAVTLVSDRTPGEGCEPVTIAQDSRAWTVIQQVAKACSISPKVILTTIQKEQSGVRLALTQTKWDKLMGMGCPDGQACNPKFKGFANQIYYGTDRLRAYRTWKSYPAIQSFEKGIPFKTLDEPQDPFVIRNIATASLYTYTPHVSAQRLFHTVMEGFFPGTLTPATPPAGPSPIPTPTPTEQASTTRNSPEWAYVGVETKVSGTLKDFPGIATVKTQIYLDGAWRTSKTVDQVENSYAIVLDTNSGKAGTQTWRVVATSNDGEAEAISKFTLKRIAPTLSRTSPSSAPINTTAKVTGTVTGFPDGATVKTQIYLDGAWRTSKTVKNITGSYSIALSTNSSKAGTQTWRVVATSKDGKAQLKDKFTLKRIAPAVTAKSVATAPVRARVQVKGSVKGFPGAVTVQTQVKVNGKWKTHKTVKNVKDSYSISLSYKSSVAAKRSWRVVATYQVKGGKTITATSKTFTVKRTR